VGSVGSEHVREGDDLEMKSNEINILLLGGGIRLEERRGHYTLVVWSSDQNCQGVSHGYRESVEIKVLANRSQPRGCDVREVNRRVFEKGFLDPCFYLAVLEANEDQFPAFTVGVYSVTEIFELRDSEFCAEIYEGKTSHFNWPMSDFLRKGADMSEFIEHGGDDFCLDRVQFFFVDCKGGENIAHRWSVHSSVERENILWSESRRSEVIGECVSFSFHDCNLGAEVAVGG
jgi:hypothetical protein